MASISRWQKFPVAMVEGGGGFFQNLSLLLHKVFLKNIYPFSFRGVKCIFTKIGTPLSY